MEKTHSIDHNSYFRGKVKHITLDPEKRTLLPAVLSSVNQVKQFSRAVNYSQMMSTVSYDTNKIKKHSIFISKDEKFAVKILDIFFINNERSQTFFFAYCQQHFLRNKYFKVFDIEIYYQRLFIRLNDFYPL